jgi:hypothetical protein
MSFAIQTDTLKSMSIENRMLLMEEIWDSLCHETDEMKSPSWHEDILNDRLELIKSGQAKFISLDALKYKTQAKLC